MIPNFPLFPVAASNLARDVAHPPLVARSLENAHPRGISRERLVGERIDLRDALHVILS